MSTIDDIPFEDLFDTTEAAIDSVDSEKQLLMLPRVARVAMSAFSFGAKDRLAAEIGEIKPDLFELALDWASSEIPDEGIAFAALLDGLAVEADRPVLRSLADGVRALSLRTPIKREHRRDVRRVAAALYATIDGHGAGGWPPKGVSSEIRVQVEVLAAGWCALAVVSQGHLPRYGQLAHHARRLGSPFVLGTSLASPEPEEAEAQRVEKGAPDEAEHQAIPPGQVLVCKVSRDAIRRGKARDVFRGHEHIVDPLPLAPVPNLQELGARLTAEYPYARSAITRLLEPLERRETFWLPPTVLLGSPGCGKSRLIRRLSELADVALWRSDAARSDGGAIAGTDRRWSSSEPCHPVLAISRARIGNPVLLLDEIDKAATRTDYGRTWDAILGFCERETAARYPDPALQVDVDVSHVSIVCTANGIEVLPPPLRDRLRVIHIPDPREEDVDVLADALLAELARDQGVDARWALPLSGPEREAVLGAWRGGSVRQLRRLLEAVWKARGQADGYVH